MKIGHRLVFVVSLFFFNINCSLAQNVSLDWVFGVGDAAFEDRVTNIAVTNDGHIIATGEFGGILDFDPGPGVVNLDAGFGDMLFLTKMDTSGNLVWAKELFNLNYSPNPQSMITDPNGNIYISGIYGSTTDFDPGVGVFNMTGSGGSSGFLVKLDGNGAFIWAIDVGVGGSVEPNCLALDASGNILVTGGFTGTADFDPGAGSFPVTASSAVSDIFIQKLDPNGNLLWVNTYGGSNNSYGKSVAVDQNANVFVAGVLSDTIDFDPGPGVTTLTSQGPFFMPADGFIVKLDPNGGFLWARQINSVGQEHFEQIDVDPSGNVYGVGIFTSTTTFDTVTATVISVNGFINCFIIKYDPSGNVQWVRTMGNDDITPTSIEVDSYGSVYTSGNFDGSNDFDPSPYGIHTMSAAGPVALYMHKMNTDGQFLWAEQLGHSDTWPIQGKLIDVDQYGHVFLAGGFVGTGDFDPGPGTTNLTASGPIDDLFIGQYHQLPCSDIAVVIDTAINGTCAANGYVEGHAINGIPPYVYEWNTAIPTPTNIATITDPGIYTLSVTDSVGCVKTGMVLVNDPTTDTGFDLNANLIHTPFQSGFGAYVWVDAFNDGCIPSAGVVTLVIDTALTYISSVPVPDQINGDTLIWNMPSNVYDSAHFQPELIFDVSQFVNIGDTICFDLSIDPIAGDFDPTNNIKHLCYPVVSAYDPNDKQIYPQPQCTQNYVLKDQTLTYTVRFQNTGNAPAINVNVVDSISQFLDINSTRIVGYSHPMITEVLPGNALKFRFDNIMLPDNVSDEVGSHGFVIFEIDLPAITPNWSVFENTAEIYFDFNPAIITNTISATAINLIDCEVGIHENSVASELIIYPNPVSDILWLGSGENVFDIVSIHDLSGKTIQTIKTSTNFIDVSTLPSGVYLLTVEDNGLLLTTKFIKE